MQEKKAVEDGVQSKRAEESEDDPGGGDGSVAPAIAHRGQSDQPDNDRQRAGKEPSLSVDFGIGQEREIQPRAKAAHQPIGRMR